MESEKDSFIESTPKEERNIDVDDNIKENRSGDEIFNDKSTEDENVNNIKRGASLTKAERRAFREEKVKNYWKTKRPEEKQKRKEKKRKLKEEGVINHEQLENKRRKKRNEEDIEYAGTIVLDSSFDSLMSSKEIKSLASQLMFCYAANQKAMHPYHLYITSFGGQFEEKMTNTNGFVNWKVKKDSKDYTEIFDKKDLVYLSSESDNVLMEIDPKKVYIIGNIVDHNKHKGITHKKATEQGISTAKLPIAEYMAMKSRKVLTVNQVVEILCSFSEHKDWSVALEKIVPKRKGAQLIQDKSSSSTSTSSFSSSPSSTTNNNSDSNELSNSEKMEITKEEEKEESKEQIELKKSQQQEQIQIEEVKKKQEEEQKRADINNEESKQQIELKKEQNEEQKQIEEVKQKQQELNNIEKGTDTNT